MHIISVIRLCILASVVHVNLIILDYLQLAGVKDCNSSVISNVECILVIQQARKCPELL